MSRTRRASASLGWGLVIGLLPVLALSAPSGRPSGADKIDVELVDQLAVTGRADFWIRMAEQADLGAAYDMDWQARGRYAYGALAEAARKTQAGVLTYLQAQGLDFDSFWIDNSVYVRGGNLAAAQDLAARGEVARIKADDVLYLSDWLAEALPDVGLAGATDDWGLAWVHAPEVWALGYDGSGIVVATIDTGVQYDHPQLGETYRGAIDGTNQYNWCDPSDICGGGIPCDNNGHGTHVMGTLSGENDDPVPDPNRIGMAPASTWITCKGCEGNTCSEYALTQCAQWIAAPTEIMGIRCGTTGTPDPDKRPHIVNNSWGDPQSSDWYQKLVQAWRALGIYPAFSAGNQNTCGSLGSPGDYPESFSSANIEGDGAINPIFSSRGPSSYGSTPYCKPNIAAPGSSIVSSLPVDRYGSYTGTSMASPHSAGAVALLWQACPSLVGQVDLTIRALQSNAATPPADLCGSAAGCADAGCNCTYGYGYLDVRAAVASCTGTVEGYVYDQDGGEPIGNASVTVSTGLSAGSSIGTTTDPGGHYTVTLAPGSYGLTASRAGYLSQTATGLVVTSQQATYHDFHLPLASFSDYVPMVSRNRQK